MKKKVLLVTSAAPAKSPFSTSEKRAPLGIGYLIAVLRKAGHEVFFIDNYLKPSDFIESGYLQSRGIDYMGIYANTVCFTHTLEMCRKMQRLRETGQWNGKIMVGGPHTTVAPDTVPGYVDHIVQGEGERAILDIVDGKRSNRVIRKERIMDLDDLPFPAWDYFISLPYDFTAPWTDQSPVFTMNTSRGCPFGCTFCSVESIWGKKYTVYSAERIVDEINFLVRHYGARAVYFREDNFTLNVNRVWEFCRLLGKHHIHIPWICETRVDTLTFPLLKEMKRSGCAGLYIGVESGSERLLKLMNKNISLHQIKSVFKWCRKLGIHTYGSFIYGLPTETFEDLVQTRKLINEIRPDRTGKAVFVGIPGSPLYRHVLDNHRCDYKDPLGFLYLKGHNERVDRYYGGNPYYKIDKNSSDWTPYEEEENRMKKRILRRMERRIAKWKKNKDKIVIYGAGEQTRTLFRLLDLQDVRIVALVDRDKRKIGTTVVQYPVIAPGEIGHTDFDEIFISITLHSEEVYTHIKKQYKNKRVSKLYKKEEFFLLT